MTQLEVNKTVLLIQGDLILKEVASLMSFYETKIKSIPFDKIDISAVDSIDGAGVAFIDSILDDIKGSLNDLKGGNSSIMRTISIFSSQEFEKVEMPEPDGFFVKIGDSCLKGIESMVAGLYLAADCVWWSVVGLFNSSGRRKGSVIEQSIGIGLNAVPIVALLSFVIGFILTLQSGFQLQKFGASVYIADLLGISIVREMGPLITAIIIAGRSGSSIASEIATMKVTEELDALQMMALNPIKYVIVPKFHAITFTMPILVAFSIAISLFAGMLISVGFLDVSLEVFVSRTISILSVKDVLLSLAKTICFAWLIVIIGSYYGMKVTGGAEGVGKATTSSVVSSIFAVILADAAFSLVYL